MSRNRASGRSGRPLAWMTGTAMMIAVTLVLGATPLGMIRTPILTATTLHIPVIIATLVLGLESGVLVGLVFGIQSIINNLASTSFFGPFFLNPLVSVLPRVLFPVCVYGVLHFVKRVAGKYDQRNVFAYVFASAIGTAAHTAMVMGMIYLLNGNKIAQMLGNSAGVPEAIASRGVGTGIVAMAVANGIPEMIVASIIAPVVALALDKAFRKMRAK